MPATSKKSGPDSPPVETTSASEKKTAKPAKKTGSPKVAKAVSTAKAATTAKAAKGNTPSGSLTPGDSPALGSGLVPGSEIASGSFALGGDTAPDGGITPGSAAAPGCDAMPSSARSGDTSACKSGLICVAGMEAALLQPASGTCLQTPPVNKDGTGTRKRTRRTVNSGPAATDSDPRTQDPFAGSVAHAQKTDVATPDTPSGAAAKARSGAAAKARSGEVSKTPFGVTPKACSEAANGADPDTAPHPEGLVPFDGLVPSDQIRLYRCSRQCFSQDRLWEVGEIRKSTVPLAETMWQELVPPTRLLQ